MIRSTFRRTVVAFALGLLLPAAAPAALATSARNAPPGRIDAAHPTVSGKLVAKAAGNGAPFTPAICSDRDRTAVAAQMVNRGLVICTEEGRLVLLQLSHGKDIFNRDWQRLAYARLAIGDHLNAWGILRNNGMVLNPTAVVQDTSKISPRLQSVTGRLVAAPGRAPGGTVICGDRDRTLDAQSLLINRGLVICTEEGKLILLQLSSGTKIFSRDHVRITLEDLTLGDTLAGRGRLQAAGFVMNPTDTVVDANLLRKSTASQDFIQQGGPVLTLFVLKSDPGPVQGMVRASPAEPTHVTLCGVLPGKWSDLKSGLTVNISGSLFNTRTMTYVDTANVAVAGCR